MKNTLPLCKCGCGQRVTKKNRKYCAGHYRNPVAPIVEIDTVAAPVIQKSKKMVSVTPISPKNKRHFITPRDKGKISDANLEAVGLSIYISQ